MSDLFFTINRNSLLSLFLACVFLWRLATFKKLPRFFLLRFSPFTVDITTNDVCLVMRSTYFFLWIYTNRLTIRRQSSTYRSKTYRWVRWEWLSTWMNASDWSSSGSLFRYKWWAQSKTQITSRQPFGSQIAHRSLAVRELLVRSPSFFHFSFCVTVIIGVAPDHRRHYICTGEDAGSRGNSGSFSASNETLLWVTCNAARTLKDKW